MAGSTDKAVGNNVYTDLIMTRYPELFDERSGGKTNANMLRWTNLSDYNMAEHVNALQDAVMAIQRTLGELAQVPANPMDGSGNPITDPAAILNLAKSTTVDDRISSLESKDYVSEFDKRYGGPSWTFDDTQQVNPTIQQHRHLGSTSGVTGMPEKIVLTEEVQGKLPKANIDLSKTTTGITGADLFIEPTSNTKISAALDEKVSEVTGGTIQKDAVLTVQGKTNTRWTREFDSYDSSATGVTDYGTLLNRAAESGTLSAQYLLQGNLSGMYFGKYVAVVRLSTSALLASDVVEISAANASTNTTVSKTTLKGTDFASPNAYKTFYLVFDQNVPLELRVRKLTTATANKIRFDYAVVTPVHPAVFDK
jgi:hypothetical protein